MTVIEDVQKRKKRMLYFAFLLLSLYVSPLFILGENAHIRVHDNLDSNVAWYKVLARSGQLFGSLNGTIPQIMNGLPRNAFSTEFSLIVWLHAILPSMTAYAISQALTRIIAFIGMYLLLKQHFIKDERAFPIQIGVALAFALTPFWPSGMLSTLGHPLSLWAFLNIRMRQYTWKEWLVIGILPLYSSFVLGFFFFLVAMGLLWLRDLIVKRDFNPLFLISIAFMTFMYLAVEYRFVYSLLFTHDPTSRNEFVSSRLSFQRCVRLTFTNFILGHHHVMTVHTFVILPITLIAFYLIAGQNLLKKHNRFIFLLGLNFALSAWYAFWFHKGWQPLKEKISLFNTFNFARFHFLRPLVIYVCFALACYILWNKGKRFIVGAIVLQIAILFVFNEEIVFRVLKEPSFKQFYAVRQFEQIQRFIGQPQQSYRVASIGLHPAIAQFNGFYTLDMYNNFYPLTYKHRFRAIISQELLKNKKLKQYFDTWGNRCYFFVSELGKKYDYRADSKKRIHHLNLNTKVFKQMGGEYIFSSVPIVNSEQNRLQLQKVFTEQESAWRVFLYKVK